MSDDHPDSRVKDSSGAFSDSTFSIEDEDECVIEDDDECVIDDDDDDDVEADNIDNDANHADDHDDIAIVETGVGYDDEDDDDEEEHQIHDQLPSVEEIKSSQAYIPTAKIIAQSNRKKKIMIVAGIGLAFVLIVVIIVISVAASKTRKTNVNAMNGGNGSPNPFKSRLNIVQDYLWSNKISNMPLLVEGGTPEHYAASFMADADNYQSQMVPGNEQRFIERYILAMVYYGMGGSQWSNQYDFLHAKDHCLWTGVSNTPAGSFVKGVECNAEGLVIGLDLSHNNLVSRRIPYELNWLIHLEKLHLHHNELGGGIPDLRQLSSIKSIGLMETGIAGSIPDWMGTQMRQLTTLALSKNIDMKSEIPHSFTNLVNMRILALDGMGLTGNINALKGMNSLEGLYLEDNYLTGQLQGNVWSHIKEIDISNNMFDGTIPDQFLQKPHLQIVDLNRNLFSGDFPKDIIINDELVYISFHQNSLEGQLSDRIGFLTNLQHLDVGGNSLTGTIPDTIKQLTNLVSLSTSGNNFTSAILYDYFSNMEKLQDLSLKANNLVGTLPNFFGGMQSLILLDLDANELSGSIPTYFGMMTNLHALMLNRNELTGTIPSEITNISYLKILLLDGNNLHGKTTDICVSPLGTKLSHFTADCYPGKTEDSLAEVECRCCTLCCNDDNLDCNNKNWMVEKDFDSLYGRMSDAYYIFGVDDAPEGWAKKMVDDARSTNGGHSDATATTAAEP